MSIPESLVVAGKPVVAHFNDMRHPNYPLFWGGRNSVPAFLPNSAASLCGMLISHDDLVDVCFCLKQGLSVFYIIKYQEGELYFGSIEWDQFRYFLNFFCGFATESEKINWKQMGF